MKYPLFTVLVLSALLLLVSCGQASPPPKTLVGGIDVATLKECGNLNGATVDCTANQLCANASSVVSGIQKSLCFPQDICKKDICPAGSRCAVVQEWPARIVCQPI